MKKKSTIFSQPIFFVFRRTCAAKPSACRRSKPCPAACLSWACKIDTGAVYVNQDGKTGLLAEPENPESLKPASQSFAEMTPHCDHNSRANAQKRAHEEFSADVMIQRVKKIYSDMLS